MSKLNINGTDKLMKQLQKGVKLDDVKSSVRKHGAELQQEAMRSAPVDTGTLRRSIVLEIEDDGFTARVNPTVEYAPYINYGTRFMTAQPFMTSSFNKQRITFLSDMQKLLK